MTILHFQEPGGTEASLLTTLLSASEEAEAGGGIFAWSTVHGVRALLDSPAFRSFLEVGTFDLIVGTDSITDPKAIETLQRREEELVSLRVRALVHNESTLFHPKMAWFHSGQQMRLIVGSGNLTRGGLQGNWEVFTISVLDGEDALLVERQIEAWISAHEVHLRRLDDPRVHEAVAENVGTERVIKRVKRDQVPTDDRDERAPAAGIACLVAEIPKNRKDSLGNSLFSQANFSQAIFESYFQVVGGENELLLYHVGDDGSLGELESRQGKYKPASRNYYFELGAAAGVPHSGAKPPIGVFLHLDSGAFLYLFRLPTEAGYDQLDELLSNYWVPKGNQGRRVEITSEELRAFWPNCPLLAASEPGS